MLETGTERLNVVIDFNTTHEDQQIQIKGTVLINQENGAITKSESLHVYIDGEIKGNVATYNYAPSEDAVRWNFNNLSAEEFTIVGAALQELESAVREKYQIEVTEDTSTPNL